MGKRAEEAVKKHHSGYNCAQAVACTFSDVIGMDEKDVIRISWDYHPTFMLISGCRKALVLEWAPMKPAAPYAGC